MKPTSKQMPVAIAIVIIAAMLGACGGDNSRTVSTSSMSKTEFADRAEEICTAGRRRALRFQPVAGEEPERDALAEAIDAVLLPAIQGVIDEIYELGAPAVQKRQTEAFLVALQRAVSDAEDLDSATMERVEALLTPSGKLARKAGLEACVYG